MNKTGSIIFLTLFCLVTIVKAQDFMPKDSLLKNYLEGVAFYHRGDFEKAVSIFEEIVRQDPSFSKAFGASADCYRRLNNPQKAMEYYARAVLLCKKRLIFRKVIKADPFGDELYADMIYYLYRLGNIDEAYTYLTESLDKVKNTTLWISAAMVLSERGDEEKTREFFCKAQKFEPTNLRLKEFAQEMREKDREIICFRDLLMEVPERHYALIIGIGRYKDRNLPNLPFALNDATAIYNILTNPRYGLFKKEDVAFLTNTQATTRNIKKELVALDERAKEDAMILVYFVGHGIQEGSEAYWITYDTEMDKIAATALSNLEIAKFLSKFRARQVAAFVDSCHSYATVKSFSGGVKTLGDLIAPKRDQERVVITSSKGNQLSIELNEFKQGLFTYFLIDALRGKADSNGDGNVDIDEVWAYLKANVTRTAQGVNHYQTPVLSGSYTSALVLSKNPQSTLSH